MLKLNNLNHVKDRKIAFAVSKRYVHKHSLIQNELVSIFTFKKISNYSFINHFYRNNEKSNIRNTLGCKFVFKGPYLWCKIAYLDDIANL